MAIRSTNANRRGGTADDLARDMQASKGRGSSSSGSNSSGRIDYRDPALNGPFYPGTTRQEFRDDPNWRYQHTPGSDRGAHTGYKPSVSPKTPWVEPSAEWYAQDEAAQAQRRSEREGQEAQIPGYAEAKAAWEAAKASGDPRATSAALKRALDIRTKGTLQLKDQRALDAFIAQGGTEETYRDRFNRDWPKPKSPLGAYSHGPGSKDWDTRFTNPVPPNTAGGGRSGGGGNDAANTTSQRQSLPDWAKGGANAGNGLANIAGYLGGGGMTEDLPPGASFDMPSNNILSSLRDLASTSDWKNQRVPAGAAIDPGFSKTPVSKPPTSKPASAPRGVRRGGGRVD